ncbi:LysR family transcriptional regulator [Ciceribacter sp. L1K23]|uniref:LysR family transcriptional regulator n=1 Tax=Ciceribacter sp. L1K23 TaxID=2820276 RepID=UPI001B824490|nr:LysR family transcriptional regulator [Ciceribacter sp. L1K23]MBR0555136.1 LysR family transcriptional regulator [Ciceribacter sp. L1K23]
MIQRFDHDDLRFLLAVAETGSTLAASKQLGVSQSTVSRRIAALEEALALELFDKRRTGYVMTEAAERLIEPARAVRAATDAFGHAVDGLSRDLSGTVRFTTNEPLAELFLPALIRRIKALHPDIRIEVDTTAQLRDLAKEEADVALRSLARAPDEAGLVGVRLGIDYWSLFCSRAYAEVHGTPTRPEDLRHHALIGLDASVRRRPVLDWADRYFPPEAVVVRQNSLPAAFTSIRAGIGIGLYSEFLAMMQPDMVRCFRPDLPPTLELWLLTHEHLRAVPRVRAVMDVAKAIVKEHAAAVDWTC